MAAIGEEVECKEGSSLQVLIDDTVLLVGLFQTSIVTKNVKIHEILHHLLCLKASFFFNTNHSYFCIYSTHEYQEFHAVERNSYFCFVSTHGFMVKFGGNLVINLFTQSTNHKEHRTYFGAEVCEWASKHCEQVRHLNEHST